MTTSPETFAIDVCADCLLVAAGYDSEEAGRDLGPTAAALAANWPGFQVVPTDGERAFVTAPCQGCSSPLAGARYGAVAWVREAS